MNATSSTRRRLAMLTFLLSMVILLPSFASAQVPRDGVLPPPEPPFKGKIGRTYKESQPDKIPVTRAPDGAPNVLVVLIDENPRHIRERFTVAY